MTVMTEEEKPRVGWLRRLLRVGGAFLALLVLLTVVLVLYLHSDDATEHARVFLEEEGSEKPRSIT